MSRFKSLYLDLISNPEEVQFDFIYLSKKRLQSKYFKTRSDVCEKQSLKNIEINLLEPKMKINTQPSVCFPNGYHGNPILILECGYVSLPIIINTILVEDDKVFPFIQHIDNVLICNQGISIEYKEEPIDIDRLGDLSALVPSGMIYLEDSGLLTVSNTFIYQFIYQITSFLSFLSYHYDFVHGHLTTSDLSYRDNDGKLEIFLCNLEYSSLSYNSNDGIVRVRNIPNISYISKMSSANAPIDYGETYNLDGYFWESNLRRLDVPYYHSFDYYTLIISCLSIEFFFRKVMDNYVLKSVIFDPLFLPEEQSSVFKDLTEHLKKNRRMTWEEIIALLKKYKLRCNAITDTYNRLTSLKNHILG